MNHSKRPFKYDAKPIRSVDSLCKALQCDGENLFALAQSADSLYRITTPVSKKDGTQREVCDARPELKKIHRKIKTEILDKVTFPSYLTGSLKGCDYFTNARLHCRSKIVISEDIQDFFPSVTLDKIDSIWRYFFSFDQDVSKILTLLTTRYNSLPQGATTSPHLANLVFWNLEPQLQAMFAQQDIVYSRYVDDISISSRNGIYGSKKTKAISSIYTMLGRKGFRAKRRKHEIATSGGRMCVTSLNVNTEKPTISRDVRAKVRAAVHRLECDLIDGKERGHLIDKINRINGQLINIGRAHPSEIDKLKARVQVVRDKVMAK